ncbi:MAG: ATP-binding protein [Solirubrobacteraceae bacterium]
MKFTRQDADGTSDSPAEVPREFPGTALIAERDQRPPLQPDCIEVCILSSTEISPVRPISSIEMDELANPFRPGAGSPPPALVGRDGLIDSFRTTVGRALAGRPGQSVMPIGLRGVGKTVLLNRFAELAEEQGLRVGYIEAPESGEFPTLLAWRLRKILLDLDRAGKASRAVAKALAVLRSFTYTLPDGTTLSVGVDPLAGFADSGNLSDDVTDLLVVAGEAARDRDTGIVLAIDEVQYLSGPELGALITAIHRTVQLNLPVVLVGAGLPQLPGLTGSAKTYAERLFRFPRIDSLGPKEARAVLELPVLEAGVKYTRDALDLLVDHTQGYPYFLQEWGYEVWNVTKRSPIDLPSVRRAEPLVLNKLDENFFLVRMDRLTPAEKAYLVAMAELGPGPHRSGDVAAQLGVRVESVAPRRSGLIRKGMIFSPAHGDTAFTVPMFDEFLRRITS